MAVYRFVSTTPNWVYTGTNSPTKFELSCDALCKVCNRVLLESVPLPLHPDPFTPMAQLVDDEATVWEERGSTDLARRPTADLCVVFFLEPTTITDRSTPCEDAALSRGVPPEVG